MEVQAGLRLCCLQTAKDRFAHIEANISMESAINCVLFIAFSVNILHVAFFLFLIAVFGDYSNKWNSQCIALK